MRLSAFRMALPTARALSLCRCKEKAQGPEEARESAARRKNPRVTAGGHVSHTAEARLPLLLLLAAAPDRSSF